MRKTNPTPKVSHMADRPRNLADIFSDVRYEVASSIYEFEDDPLDNLTNEDEMLIRITFEKAVLIGMEGGFVGTHAFLKSE